MTRTFITGLAALLLLSSATAGERAVVYPVQAVMITSSLSNEIESWAAMFRQTHPDVAVIIDLNAGGGELPASIALGKTIQRYGFDTAVSDGSVCSSGCAYAWLAGKRRFIDTNAHIGFHRSAVMPGAPPLPAKPTFADLQERSRFERHDSPEGDAKLRQYMLWLGLSDTFINLALGVSARNMTWLTATDFTYLGVAFSRLSMEEREWITIEQPVPMTVKNTSRMGQSTECTSAHCYRREWK